MRLAKTLATSVRAIPITTLCLFLYGSSAAAAQVMHMVGNISGTVNGTAVNFDINIKLDMNTGEETATISNMDPEMGAIMRQVPAMVTIGGPTGGAKSRGGKNLFELSGGNFVNSATVYWPKTGDSVELIHKVSYSGGDTMNVTATINGTVPVIEAHQPVAFKDFTEVMYWSGRRGRLSAKAPRVVTTGVGFRGDFSKAKFRSYESKAECVDELCLEETAKGSTTMYTGVQPSGPVLRSATDITTTYDPEKRTMTVHLFNKLIPIEAAPLPK